MTQRWGWLVGTVLVVSSGACGGGSEEGTSSGAGSQGGGGSDSATAGADGGGGSAPASRACMNASDLQALSSLSANLQSTVQSCLLGGAGAGGQGGSGGSAPGGQPDITGCVQDSLGLSDACSACVGEWLTCGFTNCLASCLDPAAEACKTCMGDNCNESFASCSGLPLSALP